MSLFPYFFDNSTLPDQHFGLGMDIDDLFNSMAITPMFSRYYRKPWRYLAKAASRADSSSNIIADKDKYQICLDVQHFSPSEITVKIIGRDIIVEGKHEEKEDEHGFISRHFIRKYVLPENYKPEEVTSSLSSDGILSISAPRTKNDIEETEREIPIITPEMAELSSKNETEEHQ